jgi:arginine/lysine/ornithine decarboxylase
MKISSKIFQEEQQKTPYLDALIAYAEGKIVPFHVPGHKQGRGIHPKLKEWIGESYLSLDLTEVPGLDNLSQPKEVLREAMNLAAKAYGADYSYFLVNGSSSGVHSMIMAACNPGDKILVPRNAHKSAFAGLIFSGAVPVYMKPEFDFSLQMDHTITAETLAENLEQHPDSKAVLLVSPTYYGVAADLQKLVQMIHDSGKIALVDEAWGPHFHFHPKLPISAVDAEADLVVNSTHKLLSSLTQTSLLHLKGNRIDRARVESCLRLFTTTSPNCLLLASIDACRMQMATQGETLLGKAISLAETTRAEIRQLSGVQCIGREIVGNPGAADLDPTRVVISLRSLGLTGYEVDDLLRTVGRVQIELSDLFHVVALITISDSEKEVDQLVKGIKQILKMPPQKSKGLLEKKEAKLPDWPPLKLSPREAFVSRHETIPFEKASGKISTELITTYPPGIPAIAPGEEFTKDILDYLWLEQEAGSRITGVADSTLQTVRVVKL